MEFVGHLAFGLIAISFLFRDIFWLRVLSIAASVAAIAYQFSGPVADWIVVGWNIFFILVNAIWIGVLLWERRGVRFSDEELELYETVFSTMTPVAFMKLLRIATWQNADAGRVWTIEGQPVTHVTLIYNGRARVLQGSKTVAELGDGQFTGEISFLKEQPATATVVVSQATRYLEWDKAGLHALLDRNPALRAPLEAIFTTDLAEKLRKQRK
jgi:CRP-like cAMP-binding protein